MNSVLTGMLAVGLALTLAAAAKGAPPIPPVAKPATLPVSAIDHVGLNVPDIDAAIAFFTDLMGARVLADTRPQAIPVSWKSQFNWHDSSNLQRFVMLEMAGGAKIELFQYRGPDVDPTHPHGDDAGASHIALQTQDIDASLALLEARKVKILSQPITNPDGIRWFYFMTPWGSQIELVALPRG